MNKYQEALNNYSENVDYRDYSTKTVDIVNESYDTLQELVDKETPMKVNKIDWTSTVIYRCVKCGKKITNGNYCINCGQKLDWGGDDEE